MNQCWPDSMTHTCDTRAGWVKEVCMIWIYECYMCLSLWSVNIICMYHFVMWYICIILICEWYIYIYIIHRSKGITLICEYIYIYIIHRSKGMYHLHMWMFMYQPVNDLIILPRHDPRMVSSQSGAFSNICQSIINGDLWNRIATYSTDKT